MPLLNQRDADLRVWEIVLADVPCDKLHCWKYSIDAPHCPFRPLPLRLAVHAIPDHRLHQAMNDEHLFFGSA